MTLLQTQRLDRFRPVTKRGRLNHAAYVLYPSAEDEHGSRFFVSMYVYDTMHSDPEEERVADLESVDV